MRDGDVAQASQFYLCNRGGALVKAYCYLLQGNEFSHFVFSKP